MGRNPSTHRAGQTDGLVFGQATTVDQHRKGQHKGVVRDPCVTKQQRRDRKLVHQFLVTPLTFLTHY